MSARMRGLLPVTAVAAVAASAAIATTTGCSGGPEAPRGSPVLLQAFWQSAGARTLFWSLEPDASVAPVVPAAATEIDFVFDRRMDGYRIESSDGGVPVPKADPPITVDWADAATVMSDPPLTASVFYNSIGAFGRDTSYVFVRPQPVGFPSGTAIRFALDANGLTSAYGEPMIGPAEISVTTEPLSIVSSPSGAQIVPTGFLAPVKFSTRIDAAQRMAVLAPFVHVTAAGTPAAFTLVPAAGDRMLLYVAPGACDGKWPAGVRVEVTFDVGFPDAFGRPLPTAASASFMTSTTGTAPDAGCD